MSIKYQGRGGAEAADSHLGFCSELVADTEESANHCFTERLRNEQAIQAVRGGRGFVLFGRRSQRWLESPHTGGRGLGGGPAREQQGFGYVGLYLGFSRGQSKHVSNGGVHSRVLDRWFEMHLEEAQH